MESCSEHTRSLASVTWFKTESRLVDPRTGDPIGGYWSPGSNRIVLASEAVLDGATVRHEMLHALVRRTGHPRSQFLGKCAGLVSCGEGCKEDAGPAPAPPPNALQVSGDSIEVSLEVAPENPRSDYDDGFFSVTIKARNPATYPVIVTIPGSGFGPLGTFHYDLRGPFGGISSGDRTFDPSQTVFAPGETKRRVYDFSIGNDLFSHALPPGTYLVRGAYAGHWATPITAVVGP